MHSNEALSTSEGKDKHVHLPGDTDIAIHLHGLPDSAICRLANYTHELADPLGRDPKPSRRFGSRVSKAELGPIGDVFAYMVDVPESRWVHLALSVHELALRELMARGRFALDVPAEERIALLH